MTLRTAVLPSPAKDGSFPAEVSHGDARMMAISPGAEAVLAAEVPAAPGDLKARALEEAALPEPCRQWIAGVAVRLNRQ